MRGEQTLLRGRAWGAGATHQASLLGCSVGGFLRLLSLLSYWGGKEARDKHDEDAPRHPGLIPSSRGHRQAAGPSCRVPSPWKEACRETWPGLQLGTWRG